MVCRSVIFKCIQLIQSGKLYMTMKHHKMYGEWINLSENPLIGKRALELNLFRQQLHILWRTREQKQSQWTRK
ncbi:hypothetical protein BCN_2815 [Bacillus cereus NC7401]|nr:hypothetical protein BCN_2815 [Bacillus cereus NC7401]